MGAVRTLIVAVAVLFLFGGLGRSGAAEVPHLALEIPGAPGSLRLVNRDGRPVGIGAVQVQWRDGGTWTRVTTEFNAVAACGRRAALEIAPGASLDVVPWRGFSCSGQCNRTCRANIYFGGSTVFRFVVTTAPLGEQVASPTFTMPREPGG